MIVEVPICERFLGFPWVPPIPLFGCCFQVAPYLPYIHAHGCWVRDCKGLSVHAVAPALVQNAHAEQNIMVGSRDGTGAEENMSACLGETREVGKEKGSQDHVCE